MTRIATCATAVFLAATLGACAARPTDPAGMTVDYPVPYDQLADCVIANGDWGGNGWRFIPMPTLGETRITAQGGFDVGQIWSFRRLTPTTSRLEIRSQYDAATSYARLRPTIDACVAQLAGG